MQLQIDGHELQGVPLLVESEYDGEVVQGVKFAPKQGDPDSGIVIWIPRDPQQAETLATLFHAAAMLVRAIAHEPDEEEEKH